MKKIVLLALIGAICTSSAFADKKSKKPAEQKPAPGAAQTYTSLPLGSKLPMADRMIIAADGQPINLQQQMQPNGLIVMFSCNTCPYVIKSQQRTLDVMTQIKEMRVGMVIVNSNEGQRSGADAPQRMREYAEAQRYSAPYLVDERSELANAFGATRTPEVFLFDGKGKLVYKGAMEDNPSEPEKSKDMYLLNALHAVVDGKPVRVAETKSIGCSIKREAL